MNELKKLGKMVGRLADVKRSPDPNDDLLLAMPEAEEADYLVTGDKKRPARP